MKIKLTYFKPDSGSYYGGDELQSYTRNLHEMLHDVRCMWLARELPGLMKGHSPFIVLVESDDGKFCQLIGV